MTNFWILELIKFLVLPGLAYGLGRVVLNTGVKVNYTRKIIHFFIFFLPVYLESLLPYNADFGTILLSGFLFLLTIGLMVEPVRSRISALNTAFASIDRPEDRPHTLLWLSTQVMATFPVLCISLYLLDQYERTTLIYITVIIAGIGDGLAEPVGVRFGRHKYATRALFSDRKYTRSYEGSACVFLSGVFACLLLKDQFSSVELVLALLIIPVAMTLAEAFSPHTWDSPFLYLIGGSTTIMVIEIASLIAAG